MGVQGKRKKNLIALEFLSIPSLWWMKISLLPLPLELRDSNSIKMVRPEFIVRGRSEIKIVPTHISYSSRRLRFGRLRCHQRRLEADPEVSETTQRSSLIKTEDGFVKD